MFSISKTDRPRTTVDFNTVRKVDRKAMNILKVWTLPLTNQSYWHLLFTFQLANNDEIKIFSNANATPGRPYPGKQIISIIFKKVVFN